MREIQKLMSFAMVIILGVLLATCAELNPKFEDSLNNALDAHKAEFQRCYEKALDRNRNAKGEMDLNLEFTPNSKQVDKARVTRSQIKDSGMKQCVSRAAKGIQTTELPGTWVDGKYTIDFQINR
jgi:hypothetical protein